jgi:hypothetical protein
MDFSEISALILFRISCGLKAQKQIHRGGRRVGLIPTGDD